MTFFRVIFLLCGVCLFLSSCSKAEKDITASELVTYNRALEDLKNGDYTSAESGFEQLINLYPVSYWTMHAYLNIGYIKYELQNYEEAASVTESLISVYPASKLIEYAYYLRANAYYMLIEDIERDGSSADKALQATVEYLKLFPNGRYASDIKKLKHDLEVHIDLKKFVSCRDSASNGYYLPAIRCFQSIAFNRSTKSGEYVAESWYRLIEVYVTVGLNDLAGRTVRVMEKRVSKDYKIWVERARHIVS